MEEIASVFGNDFKEPFTHDRVKDLHYLEQVVKEALRLYPSVASFQRQLTEDAQIGKNFSGKGCDSEIQHLDDI